MKRGEKCQSSTTKNQKVLGGSIRHTTNRKRVGRGNRNQHAKDSSEKKLLTKQPNLIPDFGSEQHWPTMQVRVGQESR